MPFPIIGLKDEDLPGADETRSKLSMLKPQSP